MSFALVGFLAISYLILMGIVMMVLASIQEANEDRPELETRWNMREWSIVKLTAVGALLTLPALLILIPLGLLFVV